MLGQNQDQKQNRPLSPFDKVYKNQLDKKPMSKDAKTKQRQGAILLQNGLSG